MPIPGTGKFLSRCYKGMIISSNRYRSVHTNVRYGCVFERFFVLTCGTDTACVDGTWKEYQDTKPFLPKLDTEEIRTLSDVSIKQTE